MKDLNEIFISIEFHLIIQKIIQYYMFNLIIQKKFNQKRFNLYLNLQ